MTEMKKGPSTAAAATVGAVVGATAAAGIAIAMQHPKVRKAVNEMKDKAVDKLQSVQESFKDETEGVKKSISAAGRRISKED